MLHGVLYKLFTNSCLMACLWVSACVITHMEPERVDVACHKIRPCSYGLGLCSNTSRVCG